MQEIFPRAPTGPLELIWPALLGALSRRLLSDCDVQNCLPSKNGLVGNSSIVAFPSVVSAELLSPNEFTRLRNTSVTSPFLPTTTTALRSLASTQMLPALSKALPSAPSSKGCAIRILLRQ